MDDAPKRIQRRRSKGWRMPGGAVYVGRPTKWGNPYKLGEYTPSEAVDLYLQWIQARINSGALDITELRGKDLACFCPLDQPCHVDVLLALANNQKPATKI